MRGMSIPGRKALLRKERFFLPAPVGVLPPAETERDKHGKGGMPESL